MNKLILLSLVCAGFVATTPFKASAVDSQPVGQLAGGETNLKLAQYQRNDRRFNVYYRNRSDRSWILENSYYNRREAERAARRLERRGYNTYVQLSREVNRRFG
jgi:CelD/BcsL family acetyltransferase involved in cellulose biosynthesis